MKADDEFRFPILMNMKKYTVLLICFQLFFFVLPAQKVVIADLVKKGIAMHDKGEYANAVSWYEKVLVLEPKSPQANYEIASSFLALKNYNDAIKHADIVINTNIDYMDQAYIIKGTALDLKGEPQEAIKAYKKGIQKYASNQLLYYNLALTTFKIKDYNETEVALQQSLKLNPSHASSHFILALNMLFKEQRVKGIMALYNYLLLEPKSERTASALQTLEEELQKGVKKDEDQTTTVILSQPVAAADEFKTAEIMLGLLQASKNNEANKGKSAEQLFVENSQSFFSVLGELKKDNKGFWWDFYVDYFYTLATNHHTEAFCYYITQSKGSAYNEWLKDNMPKIEAFSTWYSSYLHKY